MQEWSRTRRAAPHSAREQRMVLRSSEYSLDVNGKQIKSWGWGTGPTILLVHGWNGHGLQFYRFIDPLLKEGYQVLSFDAPAHGQSSGQHTHLLEIRDAILALAKEHGPFHAAIAHSFGVAGLSAAVNAGLQLERIIAISAPGGLDSLITRYCEAMRIPAATAQHLRQRLEERLGTSLWQHFAQTYPITADVKRSLIVHDKHDQLVSSEESIRMAAHWPNAELMLTEKLGHRRILQDPATIRRIVEFINDSTIFDDFDDLTSKKA